MAIEKRTMKRKDGPNQYTEVHLKTDIDQVENIGTLNLPAEQITVKEQNGVNGTQVQAALENLAASIGSATKGGVLTVNTQKPDESGNVQLTPANIGAEPVLAENVINGTYTKVTINKKGLITAGAQLVKGDIPALDYIPTSEKGATNGVATLVDGKVPLEQLANIDTTLFVIVPSLPSAPALKNTNKIHLVKKAAAQAAEAAIQDAYDEYLWSTTDSKWEHIGVADVDLSGVQANTENINKIIAGTQVVGKATNAVNAETAGKATTADKLTTARDFAVTGAVTGTAAGQDLSGNVSITTELKVLHSAIPEGNNVAVSCPVVDKHGLVVDFQDAIMFGDSKTDTTDLMKGGLFFELQS